MECKFLPNQVVICIKAQCRACGGASGLVEGNAYTVEQLIIIQDEVCVRVNELLSCAEHGCFHHSHFKPARETSIESLKSLQNPKPVAKPKVKERV